MSDRRPGRALLAAAAGVTAALFIAPTVASADPTASPGPEQLTTPPTVAGQTMATQPALTDAANKLKADLNTRVPNATSVVSAFYVNPADSSQLTLVAGVTGPVDNPSTELDQVFVGAASSGVTVTGLQSVNPGNTPGQAKCGNGTLSNKPVVLCAWADPGSIGLMRFQGRDLASSAAIFTQIRNEVLQ